MTFSEDAIRLLIGTSMVIEYALANNHKLADVAIEIGMLPDWCAPEHLQLANKQYPKDGQGLGEQTRR